MKKIIINEEQAKNLVEKMVSEQVLTNNRYSQEVTCGFSYHNLTYMGEPIDWIEDVKTTLSFTIDMEARTYGIKGVTVGDVRGYEGIEVDITVYPEGSDDPDVYESVVLKTNWSEAVVDNDADIGWIGIDHEVQVDLVQDGNRLAVGGILIHSKEI